MWLKPPLVATGAVRFHANQVTSGAFTLKVQSGFLFSFFKIKCLVFRGEINQSSPFLNARFFRLRFGETKANCDPD